MRGKQFNKGIGKAAQVGVFADADLGDGRLEQMAGVQRHQIMIAVGLVTHRSDDAHAQANADIGFDHVGVDGGQHQIGGDPGLLKGVIDAGAASKRRVVGDDGIGADVGQGNRAIQLGQRVAVRGHHAAVPAVAGQGGQLFVQQDAFGGDGEVRLAGHHHIADLRGVALLELQAHIRVMLAKRPDGFRQRIARLGVRGGDDQAAFGLAGELFAHALEVFGFAQDALGNAQHLLARLGHRHHALAVANKHLNAQFVFQQADLLADARLGGVQGFGGFRDVQALLGDFDQITELLQFHGAWFNQTGAAGRLGHGRQGWQITSCS